MIFFRPEAQFPQIYSELFFFVPYKN